MGFILEFYISINFLIKNSGKVATLIGPSPILFKHWTLPKIEA
jgi:hypothetical protein